MGRSARGIRSSLDSCDRGSEFGPSGPVQESPGVVSPAVMCEDTQMRSPDDFQFLDPKTVDDPYPFYAALREHAPVYRVPGTDVYLVSKRHLIEEALERHDVFSANLTDVLMTGPAGEPQLFDLLNADSRFKHALCPRNPDYDNSTGILGRRRKKLAP